MELLTIIESLRATSSTNDKEAILRANKDNEELKKLLLYTYDPFKKYGISEKIIDELINDVTNADMPQHPSLYHFLDDLAASNINNQLKRNICAVIKFELEKYRDLSKCVILKDLKIGVKATLINKVFPGLIPKFDVQLARKFGDVTLKDNELICITEKLDGIRCIIIKKNDNVKFYTRQGKEIHGLHEIAQAVRNTITEDTVVLDGELLANNLNNLNSGDLYRATVKNVNSKKENKTGIHYNVFDILSVGDFVKGKSTHNYSTRRVMLDAIEWQHPLKLVPVLYWGTNHSKINEFLDLMNHSGKEGVMVNREMPYLCKRNNGILKVKTMHTVDLKVIGYEEGNGRLSGTLGALIVDYKDNKVNVGSGFSDLERQVFWENRNDMIGKIVEIQYFEESTNEQNGISLRFPVFKFVRDDKTTSSYN